MSILVCFFVEVMVMLVVVLFMIFAMVVFSVLLAIRTFARVLFDTTRCVVLLVSSRRL